MAKGRSHHSTEDYEFSFAERTLKNLEFVQQRVKEEKQQGKEDKEIEDAFEVTQLINSFVGLLIIPREKCFNNMPDDISFPRGSEAEKLLELIISDPNKCKDTYYMQKYDPERQKRVKTDVIEEVTPKMLVLRLRNAIAHDNLTIQPVSPGKDGVITGIEFSDKPRRAGDAKKEYFRLNLTIDETEILVKALSKLLLSCYPQ